ncbi:MAG TPA: ATP-binding protein [Chitinophagaceae bacterium]|nr:ATP-binding protein [Chitinophagaceae bacterium]
MNELEIAAVAISSIKDYAIIIIDERRRILSWNIGATEIFGYTRQEITGQLLDVIFTDDDVKNGLPQQEIQTALAIGRASNDRWLKRHDGSTFYANGMLLGVMEEVKPARFIKIVRDWTEQKKVEDRLKISDRHKSEFLATLAHELRNPLASINSGLEVLMEAQDDQGRQTTQAAIYRQVQQMVHLVNDLLDISRISLGKITFKKEPVNIVEAINLSLETCRPIINGQRHNLKVNLPEDVLIVDGNVTRLSQVFLNILINAAKYTPPEGHISLDLERVDHHAIVRVRDNGLGIPKNMLTNIFEMFEQIQDRSEYPQAGLGIGLSVAKQLVELHDGRVEVFSEGKGKGCEFVVTVPLYRDQSVPAQPRSIEDDSKTLKPETPVNKRILLVDDNSDAADLLGILLKKKSFTVEKAYDGRSGINTALAFDPEIVILDLGLPDIDGYQVLKTLKEKLGERTYIALSGWGQQEDMERSRKAGFKHHIVKPVDIKTLEGLLV